MPGEGIEREVPAGEILFDGLGKLHDGTSAKRLDIASERRHLVERSVLRKDADRSVIHANGHRPTEGRHDFLRMRSRREVPVVCGPTEQDVANRAPDDPGLEPGLLERAPDPEDLVGRGHLEVHHPEKSIALDRLFRKVAVDALTDRVADREMQFLCAGHGLGRNYESEIHHLP
jgi:hypothetical protein